MNIEWAFVTQNISTPETPISYDDDDEGINPPSEHDKSNDVVSFSDAIDKDLNDKMDVNLLTHSVFGTVKLGHAVVRKIKAKQGVAWRGVVFKTVC